MGRFVTSSLNAMSTAQVGNYCQVKGRRYSNTYRTTLKVKDNSLINSTRLLYFYFSLIVPWLP
jgi:hypothetical protein